MAPLLHARSAESHVFHAFPYMEANIRKTIVAALKTAALALLTLLGSSCGGGNPVVSSSTIAPSVTTDTFSSLLSAAGTAFRLITPTTAGTVSVALVSAGPPSTIVLGLGVGIRTGTSGGCSLTVSTNAAAGDASEISLPVDPGTYCVGVYDVGNIGSTPVSFSLRITHP